MARKRTRSKRVTQAASAKRRTGNAAKKARKPTSHPKPAVPTTTESPRATDLLRGWSPSRYSTR